VEYFGGCGEVTRCWPRVRTKHHVCKLEYIQCSHNITGTLYVLDVPCLYTADQLHISAQPHCGTLHRQFRWRSQLPVTMNTYNKCNCYEYKCCHDHLCCSVRTGNMFLSNCCIAILLAVTSIGKWEIYTTTWCMLISGSVCWQLQAVGMCDYEPYIHTASLQHMYSCRSSASQFTLNMAMFPHDAILSFSALHCNVSRTVNTFDSIPFVQTE